MGAGRAGRLVAVGLAMATLLGACGSGGSSSVANLDQVRAMLRQRSEALNQGDVARYLLPMTPEARKNENRLARGSTQVPVERINLIAVPSRFLDRNAASFKDLSVRFEYHYRGLPTDNPFYFTLVYDIELQDGAWTITSSALGEGEGTGAPPPWMTGPIDYAESPNFLFLFRPGLPNLQRAMDQAETARRQLAVKLLLGIESKQLMVLARSTVEFWSIAGRSPVGTVGIFTGSKSPELAGSAVPVARQITLDEEQINSNQQAKEHDTVVLPPQVVFQHEMAHLALARFSVEDMPRWVKEGAAMYLSGEDRSPEWRSETAVGLIDDFRFADLNDPKARFAEPLYPYALAAVRFLTQTYGAAKFFDFYGAFKQLAQGGRGPDLTDNLLRRVFNISSDQLDAFTRQYIRAHLSGP